MILTITPEKETKEISKWTSKDFLIYFSTKYKESTHQGFNIPNEAWVPMMSRIKNFKSKLKLSNEDYKKFLDTVFSKFFKQRGFVPSFGAIISEKVYYLASKVDAVKEQITCSDYEFQKLQKELYSNNMLFKKFE